LRALIEAHSVGAIIGRGGATVQKIREESGAVVSILKPTAPNSFPQIPASALTERILLIKGQPDTVNDAILRITQIMLDAARAKHTSGRDGSSSDDVTTTNIRILVHQSLVGAIIGRGGEVIKATSAASGARMSVSNQPLPNSTDKSVSITGSPQSIQQAVSAILQQIAENPLRPGVRSFPYHPTANIFPSSGYGVLLGQNQNIPQVTQKIAIPSNASGAIIGKGGSVIRDLRLQSQCQISIADPDPNNANERVVTLTGTPSGIHAAMNLIRVAVENVTSRQESQDSQNPNERKPRKNQHRDQQEADH